MMRFLSSNTAVRLAAAAYAVLWLALAIRPNDRADWLLENVLVLALFVAAAGMRRWFRFSNMSLILILLFLALHTLGSHYTYAEVPYDQWWKALTGHTLNSVLGWERNNYDRVVHFSYGLLLAYPIREFFLRIVEVRGFWAYFLPLDFTLSTSALYELLEWAAASLFGGNLGMQYLGTQGDIWDAHKDMSLAALGALIAILIMAALTAKFRRDFAWEWSHQMKEL